MNHKPRVEVWTFNIRNADCGLLHKKIRDAVVAYREKYYLPQRPELNASQLREPLVREGSWTTKPFAFFSGHGLEGLYRANKILQILANFLDLNKADQRREFLLLLLAIQQNHTGRTLQRFVCDAIWKHNSFCQHKEYYDLALENARKEMLAIGVGGSGAIWDVTETRDRALRNSLLSAINEGQGEISEEQRQQVIERIQRMLNDKKHTTLLDSEIGALYQLSRYRDDSMASWYSDDEGDMSMRLVIER